MLVTEVAIVQRKTICSYPWLLNLVRCVSGKILTLRGWQLPSAAATPAKYVLILAPHTSNWDFFIMVGVASALGRQIRFMGKHQLFVGPLGMLLRWLGGVAVERSRQHNFVAQMAGVFGDTDGMVLIIAPEGTRSKVARWKGGYYHIAAAAGVPIVATALDYAKKTISLSAPYFPSGDYGEDQRQIQAFYQNITAKHPHLDCSFPNKT
ncbi:1-acyl-sn-glycerol-3-phosphate acyltransferase [Zhongshania antarctica]|jgi:1-acyl-sn-glycerol-3-phosphate acyltransferase|uniref:1-acyl-sn-glycerol-3-phosphate acyltransferase n=1 Tax=Zhongshania antarctica TaxID=641702 RepID=A0A840R0U2_9GAMM|nr:1-acyl-sn-glycerol-3-phosphate acyltransferase [Zhongshania antarctica]MBB5186347.1 1-acyl-sn-glycerol-3-phosphate acyltransferase [Zhongshania antarctica]